jgi:hypothetical protein
MRKFVAVLVVALMGAPLMAQFGGFGPTDGKALLAMPTVQEELKLSEEQKKQLKEANETLQKGLKAARDDMDFAGIPKLIEDHGKAMTKILDKLDDKQKERMVQLEFQSATKGKFKNPRVFGYAGVQKALKMSDKQKDKVKGMLTEMEKDLKEIDDDAKDDFQKRFQSIGKKNKAMAETYEKVVEGLEEEQKKSFDKVGGKAFEFPTFKFPKKDDN